MLALLLAVLLVGCGGGDDLVMDGPVRSIPRQFGDLEFTLSFRPVSGTGTPPDEAAR